MLVSLLLTVHLGLAAMWCGSMGYSLLVVQPKLARFFASSSDRLEELLIVLAHGNRWKVVPLIGVLVVSAGLIAVHDPLFLVVLGLYVVAAAVFADVSWRHWPARVFALPSEHESFRKALRVRAWTMLVLVASAFTVGLTSVTF